MLEFLELHNVGPAPEMPLEPAPRLNLITGDNGLGKSFLLDVAWWALTRRWPAEVNPKVVSGLMARPRGPGEAAISFRFTGKTVKETYRSTFSRPDQSWVGRAGRPANPGLVLYAQVDGSFSLWDPARNYWRKKGNVDVQERLPAYVLSPSDVWYGLAVDEAVVCAGLLADWVSWQSRRNGAFELLEKVLLSLSPPGGPELKPGNPTRLGFDVRDVPTLAMSYGEEVPVLHASAGIRRVIALAYFLVWSWREHEIACRQLDQATTRQVIVLVDEVEAHLHPRWQRQIVHSLLEVVHEMIPQAEVQLFVATHSPLVFAAVEPFFDPGLDAWFDLDLVPGPDGEPPHVQLAKRPFVRHGDAGRWLTSEAFDLASGGRSIPAEQAIAKALELLRRPAQCTAEGVIAVDRELRAAKLPELDPFWVRWSAFAEQFRGDR